MGLPRAIGPVDIHNVGYFFAHGHNTAVQARSITNALVAPESIDLSDFT